MTETPSQSPLEDRTLRDLLDSIAAKTPAPGGGAVASTSGALAAALAGMVVNFSLGKKRLAEHQPALEAAAKRLSNGRSLLLRLAQEDAQAFEAVNLAMKGEQGADGQSLAVAIEGAVAAPLNTIAACVDLLRLFDDLAGCTNHHLHSDLAIAAILAEATARSSIWNVRINLPLLRKHVSSDAALKFERQAEELGVAASGLLDSVEAACRESTGAGG